MKRVTVLALFGLSLMLAPSSLLAFSDDPFDTSVVKEALADNGDISKKELKQFCQQNLPEFVPFLAKMVKEDLDLYETAVHEAVDLYDEYKEMVAEDRGEDAQTFLTYKYNEFRSWKLGKEIQTLRVATLDGSGPAGQAAIQQKETELYQVLEEQYQFKLTYQKREFEEMRLELAELERVLKKRAALKDQIIRRRMMELTQDKDVMDWD